MVSYYLLHKKVVSLTITQLGINENNDYFLSKAFQQNSKIRIITLEYRLTPVWSFLYETFIPYVIVDKNVPQISICRRIMHSQQRPFVVAWQHLEFGSSELNFYRHEAFLDLSFRPS